MEVILRDDIKGLGYKNDIVKVKAGYGRNYLIPQGFAIVANTSNRKMIEENIKQASHKAEKAKKDAEAIANSVSSVEISLPAKVGESGKIFGAITTLQFADALKSKGFDIDRKKISFKGDIKAVGEYTAVIDFHKEVQQELSFNVVAE